MITKCRGRVSDLRIMSPKFGSVFLTKIPSLLDTFGKSWDSHLFHHRQGFRISKVERPEIREDLVILDITQQFGVTLIWGLDSETVPDVWISIFRVDSNGSSIEHVLSWYLTEIQI